MSTRSIYIASPEGDTGKSTVALGVLDLLVRQVQRVGVFRAVSRVPERPSASGNTLRDHVLELMLAHDGVDLSYAETVGVTYDEVHADPDAALSRIVDRYHRVAAQCDAVVVLGTDYTDVSGATELAFNARVAANLDSPVLLVVSGRDRGIEDVTTLTRLSLAELRANHAQPLGVVVNRAEGAVRTADAATRADFSGDHLPTWVIGEEPFLGAPTIAQLADAVDGTLLLGDRDLMAREATEVIVGAMTFEHMLGHLSDGAVVITPGDRTDVVLGLLAVQAADRFPSLAGLILTGGLRPTGRSGQLASALQPHVPIIATAMDTYEVARVASRTRGIMSTEAQRKHDLARAMFEQSVDADELLARLEVERTPVVTPLMFEHELIERARGDRRRVVLPEGDDDRILRAASTVLARGIADLVILGDEAAIRRRATELGLDISAAQVISPTDPEHVEQFAAEYAELRAHKGMTLERAREIVTDVSYFGTMMVHLGLADGMVSGAAHTTAHTIRPSFEIIKTQPGTSVVSSVFLMCLPDRVLAYGDCAVNPDPTAEQLADIAASSAATAAQFGVDPRVAMLSYSTGTSGSGADVDKVRTATELVHERHPEMSVEGPIQYDAAVDASVAASKLPDSAVAGKASVFIFPDLNTGNNTYKAVQRSAGAVAIGPVLQGLNKPVNDLSRGALVADIVNTVAITAIQAQSTSNGESA